MTTRAWFVWLAGRGSYGLLPGDFSAGGTFGAGLRWGPWSAALEATFERGAEDRSASAEALGGEVFVASVVGCRYLLTPLGVCASVTGGAMNLTRTLPGASVWRRSQVIPLVTVGARVVGERFFGRTFGLRAYAEAAMRVVWPRPYTESTDDLWAPNFVTATVGLGAVLQW